MRRGKVPYSQKGKILHSLILSNFFFFHQFCPYLSLSRSFLFSLIISEFGQSALTVWELNLRLRVSHFFSLFPSLITVIGALEIHKLITVKSPEIKGNKRDLRYSGIDGKNEEYPVHYEVLGIRMLVKL